ncbi:MAG TPA: glycosyltransferase family 4 protein [Gemmatimonadales bacterium]
MFGWEFPPFQAGGLATATVGLVKGLLRNGVGVTLVVPFPVDRSPLPELRLLGAPPEGAEELRVHRIPSPLLPYGGAGLYTEVLARARPSPGVRQVYGPDLFAEVGRFTELARRIAATEPHDVIDAHDWIAFGAGLAARAASGRPLLTHIHATEFDRTGGPGNPEIARREREGLTLADRIISNSQRLKDQCVERYGIRTDRVDVVHWGVDGERSDRGPLPPAPFPAGTPVVLFLGRVTQQKGPDYFMEMAGRVARYVPRVKFVLAGNGDMLPGLMQRAAELGIADRVIFAGGLHGADVDRAYRMATVCVMPSRSEPFGLVALESLQQGTPIIMPRQAGAAEVVRHAFKVDYWDIDEMTNKVVAILRHDTLRQELAEGGRRELELPRFGLDEPARRTAESYARALHQAREDSAA